MFVYEFKKEKPKRGTVVCFNDNSPAYYKIDYKGNVWGFIGEECEYCCQIEDLQSWGNYTHWTRLGNFPFSIKFDILDE